MDRDNQNALSLAKARALFSYESSGRPPFVTVLVILLGLAGVGAIAAGIILSAGAQEGDPSTLQTMVAAIIVVSKR